MSTTRAPETARPAARRAARQGRDGTPVLQRRCACGQAGGLQGDCADCDRKKLLGLQRKLAIGAADDPLEHEADRAAEQVLRGENAGRAAASTPRLSRRATAAAGTAEVPDSVTATLRAPGEPLDAGLRDSFGARFGHDFGQVRVHRDAAAARSAREVDALAYTVGAQLVFGAGQYAPHNTAGRALLAHELAHVVQQSGSTAPAVQRATMSQGALTVQIDYGAVIRVTAAQRPDRIVAQITALVGAPPSAAQEATVRALGIGPQDWLMFALQLLSLNQAAASTLATATAVDRLVAYAPAARHRPLSPDNAFEHEALRESGWSQAAQAQRLSSPSAAARTAVDAVVNPAPSTGSVGDPLDTAEFQRRLPPALRHLLRRLDPAAWTNVGTRSLSAFQAIGDVVQEEARSFFAPYADAAIGNLYDLQPAWHASANIFDVGAMAPTADQRIGYLLNRAEIVGRSTATSTTIIDADIFDETHFDGSRPADRTELMAIASALEADATFGPMVDRLLQHTGRKSGVGAGTSIGLVTEFDADRATACADHWSGIDTLCHEVLHALVHPNFNAVAGRVRFPQVIREGFTEVLGVQLFNDRVLPKAASNAAFKSTLEAGVSGAPCTAPAAATIGYGAAGSGAEAIRTRVGDSNFRAAYFLGRPELAGLA